MENEGLKEKMVKIIINAIWKDAEADYDSTDESEAISIADALVEAGYGDVMSYQRMTKLSDLGTLHALDFNGEEQPLGELTALDTDVLIRRLYELENKIESGELGDVKELKQELKAQEIAANAYRIWFWEQKYWREVAERALDLLAEYAHEFYMKTRFVGGYFVNDPKDIRRKFLKQAEKELTEEGK